MRFKTSFFGYNKKQINEYMKSISKSNSETLEKQKQRIFAMRQENETLTMEINSYRHKEKAIMSAMVDSRKIADSIVKSGREMAIDELQKLLSDINFANESGGITPFQLKMAIDDTCKKLKKQIVKMEREDIR